MSRAGLFALVAGTLAGLSTGSCTQFQMHGPGIGGDAGLSGSFGGDSGALGKAGEGEPAGAPSAAPPAPSEGGGGAATSGGASGNAGDNARAIAGESAAYAGAAGAGGTAGTGGEAGEGGVAAASAGSACPSATNSGYRVGFYPENKHATEQEVHPFFRITNTTGVFPSLTKIKLRYYFTKEPSGAETGTCFWVTGNLCSSLSFQFHDQVPSLATANRFMELTFTATNAVLDGAALEVRTGFTVAHRDLTQTNDYSFDAAAGVTATPGVFPYRDWDRVTLYVDGVLVWGTEPCVN